MTTTTKSAKGKEAPKVEKEWEDAPRASGGDGLEDVPAWVPHWGTFRDEVIAEKLETVPPGSHAHPVISGTLVVARAYNEPRYFVKDVEGTIYALPLHGVLTAALDNMRADPAPRIRLQLVGESKKAKKGQRSAFLYDVRCLPKDALLTEPRKDALLPVHKANKAKRDAEKRAAEQDDDAADE